MNFDDVIRAIGLAGSNLPAFQTLFRQVLTLFNETDQDKLKAAYAAARAESDAADLDLREAIAGR